MSKILINGMGILGRTILRKIISLGLTSKIEIELNDPYITNGNLAYLLSHDSIYGELGAVVSVTDTGIIINGINITVSHEKEVSDLKWKGDVVLECTGDFDTPDKASVFTDGGVKYVICCYPSSSGGATYLSPANAGSYQFEHVVYTGDVETQLTAIVCKLIDEQYTNIVSAIAHAFAAYTNAQNTIDSLNNDNYAVGRAAAWNISPFSKFKSNVGKIVAKLNGKTVSTLTRAPVIAGGEMNIDFRTEKTVSASDLNAAVKNAGNAYIDTDDFTTYGELIDYTEDALVSSDVVGSMSVKFLAQNTIAAGENSDTGMITVLYDNIMFFVNCIIIIMNKILTK